MFVNSTQKGQHQQAVCLITHTHWVQQSTAIESVALHVCLHKNSKTTSEVNVYSPNLVHTTMMRNHSAVILLDQKGQKVKVIWLDGLAWVAFCNGLFSSIYFQIYLCNGLVAEWFGCWTCDQQVRILAILPSSATLGKLLTHMFLWHQAV